ncbi:MAG: helix-turn-helix domain-containing protein [Bdellovibrionia bacterium]
MSTSQQDIQAILQALKKTIRARGSTYADLAKKMGVSEVTIKRLFSIDHVSMKHLLSVCDILNVSLLDLAVIARDASHSEYILNEAQDRFFAASPRHYAIFIDLYRRKPASEVKKYWGLNDRTFFNVLRDLEKLELLDVLPKNNYRFKMSGPVRVPKQGKLIKLFFTHNIEFLEHVQAHADQPECFLQTSEVLLSKEHSGKLLNELKEIAKKVRDQSFVDETTLPARQKESVRWLFAFAPYETDWRKHSPK